MTSTGNLLTDILALYLPLALALIMGVIGLFRGARREAVVSFSIVLAALIVSVWADSWSSDLHETFGNFAQQNTQIWLGVIVVALVTLVIGYGLGSATTPRGPLTGMSRLGGLLIGLGNGAALGGWILRNYYNALLSDLSGPNANTFSAISDNVISRSLIIWAGWFPLVVAIIAAIVALTGPFRRVQTVVATPAAQTNWTPSTAPAVAATGAAAATAPYSQQYPQQYSQQQYSQPAQYPQQYAPQLGSQPQPSAQPQSAAYAPSGYVAPTTPYPSSQPTSRVPDAPPTMPMSMPSSSQTRSAGGQETVYMGGSSASPGLSTPSSLSSPSLSSSSSQSPWSGPPTPSTVSSRPDTGPLGDLPDDSPASSSASSSPSPAWAQPPDSSWLSSPTTSASTSTPSSSPTVDNSLLSRSEAPTMANPVGATASSSSSPALTNCPRCGAAVPGDAMFCTECGNRLKA